MPVHDGYSSMYNERRNGQNTEPCVTPVLISSVSDVESLNYTTSLVNK